MIQKLSKHDYEQLGRMIESIYETNYANHGRAYRVSFIKGVLAGFGGVIGATIVVGVVAWVLSLFHQVPFINTITDNVRDSVQQDR